MTPKVRRSLRKLHIRLEARRARFPLPSCPRTMWMMPPESTPCWVGWPVMWRCLPTMAPTTTTTSIRLWRNHCRHAVVFVPRRATAYPAGRRRPISPCAIAISSAFPKGAGSRGRRQRATTNATASRATIGRYKQVIGDGRRSTRGRVRSRKDPRRNTEVGVAFDALNRMLKFGRPISVRIK
jgi:hypothetical protein